MINFHRGSNISGEKMLRICAIFFLLFVAVRADGEFIILNAAESISFEGNNVLRSEDAGDVLNAIMAEEFSDNADWPVLYINDPFELPQKAVIVSVEGAKGLNIDSALHSFQVSGNSVPKSLKSMNRRWYSDVQECFIDFEQAEKGMIKMERCLGDIKEPEELTSGILKSSDKDHNNILKSINGLNAFADKITEVENSTKFIFLRIDLSRISDFGTPSNDKDKNNTENHPFPSDIDVEENVEEGNSTDKEGESKPNAELRKISKQQGNNEEVREAFSLLSFAIANIQSEIEKVTDSNILFVVFTTEGFDYTESSSRSKRDVLPGSDKNEYNLATYYDQNYPVIFNIILWFMVIFGLSLLAICYAIADMDPGRDSIIYRMTSTRMKKDN